MLLSNGKEKKLYRLGNDREKDYSWEINPTVLKDKQFLWMDVLVVKDSGKLWYPVEPKFQYIRLAVISTAQV